MKLRNARQRETGNSSHSAALLPPEQHSIRVAKPTSRVADLTHLTGAISPIDG